MHEAVHIVLSQWTPCAVPRPYYILISTVSAVEAKMVVYARRGHRAVVFVDDLFALPIFEITPPDPADMDAAYAALFACCGGHPAALNFGDVFAYAVAKVPNLALLFKGNDFSETDIQRAEAGSV